MVSKANRTVETHRALGRSAWSLKVGGSRAPRLRQVLAHEDIFRMGDETNCLKDVRCCRVPPFCLYVGHLVCGRTLRYIHSIFSPTDTTTVEDPALILQQSLCPSGVLVVICSNISRPRPLRNYGSFFWGRRIPCINPWGNPKVSNAI